MDVHDGGAGRRRRILLTSRDAGQAALGLEDQILTGAVLVRPFGTEPGCRAVDQPRVDPGQLRVPQAQAVHDPGPEVLDKDVAPLDEAMHDLLPERVLEVDRQASLVTVNPRKKRLSPLMKAF